ncbi:MAG: trimethylamine methyltransferase family protein [Chloroflexota bacterium]
MRPAILILSDEQFDAVIEEALRILSVVGVKIAGRKMRARLVEAGIDSEGEDGRLLFPPERVRAAIESTPSSFTLFDRDGNRHAELGSGRTHFVPGSSGLAVLDHRSGEHRSASTADFIEYIRLGDQLKNIDYLATAFSTDDIEPLISDAWRLYLSLANSTKPVVSGAFSEQGVPRMVELMQLYRRDRADLIERPMAIFTVTPAGSFAYNQDSCQNLIDCVEAGIPVELVPVTLMGLIAPVTTLGAAAFHTADVLAGVTMAQTIKAGAPLLFGAAPAAFHMQNTTSPMTAVEAMRLASISALIAGRLGLPSQAYLAFSEGKVLDAQAGAETAMGALLAVTAGVDSVSGPGMLDYLLTFSLPKLVLDDELAAQAQHFARDITPAGDLPTTDLVKELLVEGHIVVADHTMEHWPAELYLPGTVIDRDARDTWASKGGLDVPARAISEVERHLAAWEQPETDPAIDKEARAIITAGLPEGAVLPG